MDGFKHVETGNKYLRCQAYPNSEYRAKYIPYARSIPESETVADFEPRRPGRRHHGQSVKGRVNSAESRSEPKRSRN